jgi:hypothetical protein
MSAATALGGPALLAAPPALGAHPLYAYAHPQLLGVPLLIVPVYFCGGPAVGLLARRVWASLQEQQQQRQQARARRL